MNLPKDRQKSKTEYLLPWVFIMIKNIKIGREKILQFTDDSNVLF